MVVDGRPLTSVEEQDVILSLFSLLHRAVTVPATTLAIEQSRGVELYNIDDVVVYAQTSKSFMVSCLRALGSGSRRYGRDGRRGHIACCATFERQEKSGQGTLRDICEQAQAA